ncbi:hypothetical protein ACFL5O_09520 [Myxococcota bacterium]
MIDENAFGIAIGYYSIENDEYALEREEFQARLEEFRDATQSCLAELPLGTDVRALDLGHLVYVEVAAGDQSEDPLRWLRNVRGRLAERGFETLGVITYGGRWVPELELEELPNLVPCGPVQLCCVSHPSEPLRRALQADAAAHYDEESLEGWGPGFYVDTEAIESLGHKLKNAPTELAAGGTSFYRIGS